MTESLESLRSTTITITHPLGLHLRIGKDVVQAVSGYDAQMTAQNLTRQSPAVNARSILQLLQLQARQGHQLQLSAQGPDADRALDAVRELLAPAGSRPDDPA
jgi:phosphocarrier protein FPr